MNKGLFLPLEVVKREYIGRLCLAAEMAARGMPVFLGHKKWIIRLALESGEPGVFFHKDAAFDRRFAPALLDKGFGLVAQDEEAGIIYGDYEQFYSRRRSLDDIPNLHRFFCWGRDDYEFLSARFCNGSDCNVVNTGAVKTVFWGRYGREYFAREIRAIRERYGRFIMFITNFGVGNSYLPERELLKLGEKESSDVRGLYGELRQKETRLMRFAVEAAKQIAERTDFNVVIRPHPTESIESWRRSTAGIGGVHIEPEGDLSPWLLAAEGVLHNSCTSGIQSAASDVPVIAFGEKQDDLQGVHSVPNDVSVPALGMDDVLEAVTDLRGAWQSRSPASRRLLQDKLKDAGSLGPLTGTADAIIELAGEPDNAGCADLGRDSLMYNIREVYRTSRLRRKSAMRTLDQKKRPTLRKKILTRDLDGMLELLGHDIECSVSRVAANSFCIRRVDR